MEADRVDAASRRRARLETWGDKRLERAGLAVLGLVPTRLPKTLFGRPVVRLELPKAGKRAPPELPKHHRFGAGDLCLVSDGKPSFGEGARPKSAEGTVLRQGAHHVDVVPFAARIHVSDESRRRRGRDVDLSEETSRGDAAAATWIYQRRRVVATPRRRRR